jgi:hypothetical protein
MPEEDAVSMVHEFWSLRAEEERARVLDAEPRKRLRVALEEAREQHAAAQTLYSHGHRARGLAEAQRAYATFAGIELPDPIAKAREGLSVDVSDDIPKLDHDFSEAHAAAFAKLSDTLMALEDALAPYAATPKMIASRRLQRRFAIALAVVLALGGVAWLALSNHWKASASAALPFNGPKQATDGNVETPWLLPAGTPGWMELTTRRPRSVSQIRLCPPLGGGGAKKVEIAFYRAGSVVKTLPVTIDNEMGIYPAWTTLDVGESVDRVRISVLTWTGSGGGLGDVQLVD